MLHAALTWTRLFLVDPKAAPGWWGFRLFIVLPAVSPDRPQLDIRDSSASLRPVVCLFQAQFQWLTSPGSSSRLPPWANNGWRLMKFSWASKCREWTVVWFEWSGKDRQTGGAAETCLGSNTCHSKTGKPVFFFLQSKKAWIFWLLYKHMKERVLQFLLKPTVCVRTDLY